MTGKILVDGETLTVTARTVTIRKSLLKQLMCSSLGNHLINKDTVFVAWFWGSNVGKEFSNRPHVLCLNGDYPFLYTPVFYDRDMATGILTANNRECKFALIP